MLKNTHGLPPTYTQVSVQVRVADSLSIMSLYFYLNDISSRHLTNIKEKQLLENFMKTIIYTDRQCLTVVYCSGKISFPYLSNLIWIDIHTCGIMKETETDIHNWKGIQNFTPFHPRVLCKMFGWKLKSGLSEIFVRYLKASVLEHILTDDNNLPSVNSVN